MRVIIINGCFLLALLKKIKNNLCDSVIYSFQYKILKRGEMLRLIKDKNTKNATIAYHVELNVESNH